MVVLLSVFFTASAFPPFSPLPAFLAQVSGSVVGGNCSRHGIWRGSSDCPGCLRERNAPRQPTAEELDAQRRRLEEERRKEAEHQRREDEAARALSAADELYRQVRYAEADAAYSRLLSAYGDTAVVREALSRIREQRELHEALDRARVIAAGVEKELEEKKKEDEARQKNRTMNETIVTGLLDRLKGSAFEGAASGGLDFTGGTRTLFEKGSGDSAPVDTRVKGPSRLDLPGSAGGLEFMSAEAGPRGSQLAASGPPAVGAKPSDSSLGIEVPEAFRKEIENHVAFHNGVMSLVDEMKLPPVKWADPPHSFREGVLQGLFTDQKTADQFMRQSPLPFPVKGKDDPGEYSSLTKAGKALGLSFGIGRDPGSEVRRGVLDDLTLAKQSLGSPQGKAVVHALNGTKFDRLLLHSNGATVGEALIRKDVIRVDTLHIAGGDRSLVNGGLQELLDTGKVKRIVVWLNPGDPVPLLSANAVTVAAETFREAQRWIRDAATREGAKSGRGRVEYRVLAGEGYQGQETSLSAHSLTTYVANMRVYYQRHPGED